MSYTCINMLAFFGDSILIHALLLVGFGKTVALKAVLYMGFSRSVDISVRYKFHSHSLDTYIHFQYFVPLIINIPQGDKLLMLGVQALEKVSENLRLQWLLN